MLPSKLIRTYAATEKFPLSISSLFPQVPTPAHRHDFVEVCLVASGSGVHEAGGERRRVSRGDIYMIPRSAAHQYAECSPDFDVLNILYVPELIPMPKLDISRLSGYEAFGFCGDPARRKIPYFTLAEPDFAGVLALARELEAENRTRNPGHLFNMLGIFMHLMGKLIRLCSRNSGAAADYSPSAAAAVAYLNRHFAERVDIAKLCAVSHMSKATLLRNFFRDTGTTPRQYQLQQRIAEAAVLLRTTAKPLHEIALQTGFSDSNYFGRQFRRLTGLPPGEFRKEFRDTP